MIGSKLAHYEITSHQGSGGMGDVYQATDSKLGRSVAIKLLPDAFERDTERVARFEREARVLASLNHPNIASIYGFEESEGRKFLVMELVEGETLAELIERRPVGVDDTLKIAKQIAEALDAAHEKDIIHCDLKPANVKITPNGKVKILDFGIAKVVKPSHQIPNDPDVTTRQTDTGTLLGTVQYMSPEQALGRRLNHRSDIFSFGTVLYEMVTGVRPFSGATPIETINCIINTTPAPIVDPKYLASGYLVRIINKCLEKDPDRRYQTARELLDELSNPAAATRVERFRKPHAAANNLPQEQTRFVGRDADIAEVARVLSTTRFVTLTGTGGCGKTRLALEVGSDLLDEYPDGVWFVELAAVSDPTLVPQTVASVLGAQEERGRSVTETLADRLKARQLLLILDNCEHLIEACARVVEVLLQACPNIRILATSREVLRVTGESAWRVPSLPVPDLTRLPRQSDELLSSLNQCESVQLFLARATSVQPTFKMTAQNAAAIAEICARLDGIPLATELAAARVRVLSIDQINGRSADRFRLLTGGNRTALPRQQTLRATLDWSYELLSEKERILLGRLSVFSGGWRLEAAEFVCQGHPIDEHQVLDLLTDLVDKSLVILEQEETGETRFRFLETVRQYAEERLREAGEEQPSSRARHAKHFLAMVEQAEMKIKTAEQPIWLTRMNTEHDNLRAALNWTLRNDPKSGLRLAAAAWGFWYIRGHFEEGRRWLTSMLAQPGAEEDGSDRAKALIAGANSAISQGDYPCARVFLDESLAIGRQLQDSACIAATLAQMGRLADLEGDYASARALLQQSKTMYEELGNDRGVAGSLSRLGDISGRQGDYASARSLLREGLAIQRRLDDREAVASSLNRLGNVEQHQGDYSTARSLFEESLALWREMEDRHGIASLLHNLGDVAILQRDYGAARSSCEESLAITRDLGDQWGTATNLLSLGMVALHEGNLASSSSCLQEGISIGRQLGSRVLVAGALVQLALVAFRTEDFASARSLAHDALKIQRELGDQEGMAYSFENLAALARSQDQAARAARLWGTAESLREVMGCPIPPDSSDEYHASISAAKQALGDVHFAVEWLRGREMTLQQAVAYALEETAAD